MEVVAGTVKPLGRRDRELSNATPLEGIFPTQIFQTHKSTPYTSDIGGLKISGSVPQESLSELLS